MPTTIEEKLAKYRAEKAQEGVPSGHEAVNVIPTSNVANSSKSSGHSSSYFICPAFCKEYIEKFRNTRAVKELLNLNKGPTFKVIAVKIIVWLLTWALFIKFEFGAIFFLVSLMYFIYYNTRTGSKNANEPSAYSVFNPDCQRIAGTFTAEQFEQQLRFGSARQDS